MTPAELETWRTLAACSLPLRLVSEANAREHWGAKARRVKQHRYVAGIVLRPRLGKVPAGRLAVVITRVAPRRLDGDNLQASAKALRDGIADALGIDDGDARVTWLYRQRAAKTYACEVWVGREP